MRRHLQRSGRIDAMQVPDPGRHQPCPAPGTAAHVEAAGIVRQGIPGEDGKILVENAPRLLLIQAGLVKA